MVIDDREIVKARVLNLISNIPLDSNYCGLEVAGPVRFGGVAYIVWDSLKDSLPFLSKREETYVRCINKPVARELRPAIEAIDFITKNMRQADDESTIQGKGPQTASNQSQGQNMKILAVHGPLI